MEIISLHRKLLLEATLNCTSSPLCYDSSYCCVKWSVTPSPSPAPSVADQSPAESHNNHAVPYLVSFACVLGVFFLILTTCTILLRSRSTSRRVASSSSSSPSSVYEDRSPVDHPIWHIVTVGLSQSVIDSISSVKYKSSDGLVEESDCSVCLTGFEDGDDLRLLPKCSHAFHIPCIDTWLRSHKTCPLCRSPVVNESPPPIPNLSDSTPNSTTPGPSESGRMDNSDSTEDHDLDTFPTAQPATETLKGDLGVPSEDFEAAVRRSVSLDDVGLQTGEGSSQQHKMIEVEGPDKEESGISRLIKSSSSIGRSSAKILSSFRGSKSQSSSTLPHL